MLILTRKGDIHEYIDYPVHLTGLVMMDCWQYIDHLNQNLVRIVRLIKKCRKEGIRAIDSSNGTRMHPLLPFDVKLSPNYEGLNELRGLGLRNLWYMGYHTDRCILDRFTGIKSMYGMGYSIVLIRDATEGTGGYEEAIRLIETYGRTTTIKDVMEG